MDAMVTSTHLMEGPSNQIIVEDNKDSKEIQIQKTFWEV